MSVPWRPGRIIWAVRVAEPGAAPFKVEVIHVQDDYTILVNPLDTDELISVSKKQIARTRSHLLHRFAPESISKTDIQARHGNP